MKNFQLIRYNVFLSLETVAVTDEMPVFFVLNIFNFLGTINNLMIYK